MGRRKITGKYDTREELVEEVMGWMRINNNYAITAKIVRVSPTMVSKIYNAVISGVALP